MEAMRKEVAFGEVFDWLWDGKFDAWAQVREVPRILIDPIAREKANSLSGTGAIKKAIEEVIVNDPVRTKDKSSANHKIKNFGDWLDAFKREDFKTIDAEALAKLKAILEDVVKILSGLQGEGAAEAESSNG
jgi:hypothetical protein